ncbi:MAG: UDP-glucose 4-epimerase [Anaerolineales bacterium]|nr:UDP-glucose 4-epimerase [Anaerolineales bacterium]
MAHYLVTGAAGFIGARTSEMLIEQGHTVVGVDNLNDAYDVRIKEFRLRKLQALDGFEFVRDDISDREILNRQSPITNRPFDAVINLAARAGVRYSVSDPWTFLNSNVLGTLNMLELCRQTGCKKFLLASTSSIYGANPPYPTPETASSSEPLQPYAASKKGAEVLAHSYHYLHNIDVSVVRYFTVYGPAGRPDLAMFRFVQWISEGRPVLVNGDGKQSRGFTFVDDIARGTIAALKPLGFEIVNLGGHEVISINDLIGLTEEVVGKPAQVQYGPPNLADMFQNWADVSKARQLLGWQPQVGLREGMERLVEWYRAEREWAKDIVTA